MSSPVVLLAPVAAEIIASALTRPSLLEEVAFGARVAGVDVPPGTPVFIYVSAEYSAFHPLLHKGHATWGGTLTKITPAVATGIRRGMHADPRVRPPFAESYDYRDATCFWHVAGLTQLQEPVALDRFRDDNGLKVFGGLPPQCLTRARLVRASSKASLSQAA